MPADNLPVIPTPWYVEGKGDDHLSFSHSRAYTISLVGESTMRLRLAGAFLAKSLHAQHGLEFQVSDDVDDADVVIELDAGLSETDDYGAFFEEENAREQGYLIEVADGAPVRLRAPGELGCLYAAATLSQLFAEDGEGARLDHVAIRDRPDFRYRGVRWLIWVEMGVWAYDRGDGPEAFRRRIVEKLDMALTYKINVVIFDGFGWGTDSHPQYASLMQDLNREARLRGIHLMHGGYGAGHAGAFRGKPYRGEVFENRDSYPEGPIYDCIAGETYCGTCLSNAALNALRLAELQRFVSAVEPGALYIHQQDEGLSGANWRMRCPACRQRWPNDALNAEDGMAGAYAWFYDLLVEAIQAVKTPGYDAARDCLILPISPGYLSHTMDDEEWQSGLEYWKLLGRLMQHRNGVYPAFRELFCDRQGDRLRTEQLDEALRPLGLGFAIIHFYGADGHYNDKLFLANAVLNYVFAGAEMLVSASGHAYMEPLQLLDAEYMWNRHGSGFYNLDEKPVGYDAFKQLYYQSQYALFRPDELFGPGGFLEVACARLYGRDAAPDLARMFLTAGENGEPPVPFLRNSALIRGEARGSEDEAGMREGSIFEHFEWPASPTPEMSGKITTRIRESLQATVKAADLLDKVLARHTLAEGPGEDLEWYRRSLECGVEYVGYLHQYLEIYQAAKGAAGAPATGTSATAQSLLVDVSEARARSRDSGLAPIDHQGGVMAGREEILDFLEDNLEKMAGDTGA